MKIGFYLFYPQDFWAPGGGVTHILNLSQALKKLGQKVEFFDIWRFDSVKRYDILIVMGSSYHLSDFVVTAEKAGEKVVVIPVALSLKPQGLWKLGRFLDKLIPVDTTFTYRKRIYDACDSLIVQSQFELSQLSRNFDIPRSKFSVIPNGVEEKFVNASPDPFIQKYKVKDFVLMVGRICENKGQLRLLEALGGQNLPLVFIGGSSPLEPKYFERFKEKIKIQQIKYLGYIPHDSPILASAFAAAKVVTMISLYETFGNVCLEAAAARSNVVVSRNLPISEFMGNRVYYCDPKNIMSIREAIQSALSDPRNDDLHRYVISNFSWEAIAKLHLNKFRELMNKGK